MHSLICCNERLNRHQSVKSQNLNAISPVTSGTPRPAGPRLEGSLAGVASPALSLRGVAPKIALAKSAPRIHIHPITSSAICSLPIQPRDTQASHSHALREPPLRCLHTTHLGIPAALLSRLEARCLLDRLLLADVAIFSCTRDGQGAACGTSAYLHACSMAALRSFLMSSMSS